MNSFRDAITNGRLGSGPVMPAKQGRQPEGAEGLTGVAVPRSESRTHNQRSEQRQALGTGQAHLFVKRKSYVVDLLNLSGGGAMVRTNLPLKLWDCVHLEMAEGERSECAVRWIKGDRIGLEFAHETQIGGDAGKRDAMLLDTSSAAFPSLPQASLARAKRNRRRTHGAGRSCAILDMVGQILYDFESTRTRLRNVSEHGVMVECARASRTGGSDARPGRRRPAFRHRQLVIGDQLGLRFQQMFDIACLAKAKPEVAPQRWSRPDYLNAAQGTDSPWAEPWPEADPAGVARHAGRFSEALAGRRQAGHLAISARSAAALSSKFLTTLSGGSRPARLTPIAASPPRMNPGTIS